MAVAVLAAGCGEVPADVAATVNGEEIRTDELARILVAPTAGPAPTPAASPAGAVQRRALSLLIQVNMLEQAVEERGVEVTEEDLQASELQQTQALGGPGVLEARLQQLGLAAPARQVLFRLGALQRKLAEAVASPGAGPQQLQLAYRQLFQELASEAEIQVNDRIGRWDPSTALVAPPEPLVGPTRQPEQRSGDDLLDPTVPTPAPGQQPTAEPAPRPTLGPGAGQ